MSEKRKPEVVWTSKDELYRIVAEYMKWSGGETTVKFIIEKRWLDSVDMPSWRVVEIEDRSSAFILAVADLLGIKERCHQ